jgi:hypothetical protein
MTDIRDFLKESTVLVLGAGASKPYGFPIGNEVKGRIRDCLNDSQIKANLISLGFQTQLLDEFKEILRYGAHSTIDTLLEKKTHFRELGSYLIASTIMPQEMHDNLFPQRDWYGELFNALDFENDKEPDTRFLSVVTLNYDRSFEHFLNKNIGYNCHNKYLESAHKKRENIVVVHAHGSLGEYPSVPYGLNINDANTLRKAAESIKIVSDRLEDSPDFQRAQDVIANANNIIFLGIGYDDRTLKSLLAKTDINSKQIIGTSLNLDEPTRQHIRDFFNNRIKLGGMTCMDFLKHIQLAQ